MTLALTLVGWIAALALMMFGIGHAKFSFMSRLSPQPGALVALVGFAVAVGMYVWETSYPGTGVGYYLASK